jgi:hypothetical protein
LRGRPTVAVSLAEPAVAPTGFDFTCRDSLGLTVREISTLLRETIERIQSDPFEYR